MNSVQAEYKTLQHTKSELDTVVENHRSKIKVAENRTEKLEDQVAQSKEELASISQKFAASEESLKEERKAKEHFKLGMENNEEKCIAQKKQLEGKPMETYSNSLTSNI